jgi:ABC-type dipeptide/oligopeptide/nickel transport system permease component
MYENVVIFGISLLVLLVLVVVLFVLVRVMDANQILDPEFQRLEDEDQRRQLQEEAQSNDSYVSTYVSVDGEKRD